MMASTKEPTCSPWSHVFGPPLPPRKWPAAEVRCQCGKTTAGETFAKLRPKGSGVKRGATVAKKENR